VEVTLAHELVHALQDQHYDLGPRLKYQQGQGDRQSAIHALAEGDATSLMLDYTLKNSTAKAYDISDETLRLQIIAGMALSPEMAEFPRILRDSLLAPYVDGLLFVHQLRRLGGWATVDKVWLDPPTTTEQILHLEKYQQREEPEVLSAPIGPSGNWQIIHSETYGELGVRIALEEWMPRRRAKAAATGWAGDQAAVFRHQSRDISVILAAWKIRFDKGVGREDQEVQEAWEALLTAFDKKVQVHKVQAKPICIGMGESKNLAVWKHKRDIILVAGPSSRGERRSDDSGCEFLISWANQISQQP